jgi:hypothetical protein
MDELRKDDRVHNTMSHPHGIYTCYPRSQLVGCCVRWSGDEEIPPFEGMKNLTRTFNRYLPRLGPFIDRFY